MEAYFQAKRRLFEMLPRDAPSLINVDDPRGAALAEIGRPSGDLRDRPRRRHHAGAAVVLARRAGVRRPHAARHRCTCARRSSGGRTSTTSSPPSRPATALGLPFDAIERGIAVARRRARPVPGRVERRGRSHGRRRLRAHRRRAAEPARDGAAAGARPADHGVRLRRRSRSHEASADGRGRRPAERS